MQNFSNCSHLANKHKADQVKENQGKYEKR